jgi:hypothetical protein
VAHRLAPLRLLAGLSSPGPTGDHRRLAGSRRSLRPWLVASIVGDLTDIAATVIGRHQLPPGVAGASALASAALGAALDA